MSTESTARPTTGEPRMPERTRLVRPSHWTDERTGQLRPDVRDLYLGLATLADDDGYLLWRPATLAARLYPFTAAGRRLRDLARRAAALIEAGLLTVYQCGCGFLPFLTRDLGLPGGNHTWRVRDHHATHASTDESVQVRTPTDLSRVVSVSVSEERDLHSLEGTEGLPPSSGQGTEGYRPSLTVGVSGPPEARSTRLGEIEAFRQLSRELGPVQ